MIDIRFNRVGVSCQTGWVNVPGRIRAGHLMFIGFGLRCNLQFGWGQEQNQINKRCGSDATR